MDFCRLEAYVCMYRFATIKHLQEIIMNIENGCNTIQYNINFKIKKHTGTKPIITEAGIELKGQADHISIIVPLDVLARLVRPNMAGRDDKGS